MRITQTKLNGLLIIEPKVFGDERGFFFESYNEDEFNEAVGEQIKFVQDNHSCSSFNVLRGIHLQSEPYAQGKLVRCCLGSVLDVAVDLRKDSSSYGKWFSLELSSENKKQLWIPPGFGHGFLTLTEKAEFLYKTTSLYYPQSEITLAWDDAEIGIDWWLSDSPIISDKDAKGISLNDYELLRL